MCALGDAGERTTSKAPVISFMHPFLPPSLPSSARKNLFLFFRSTHSDRILDSKAMLTKTDCDDSPYIGAEMTWGPIDAEPSMDQPPITLLEYILNTTS